MKPWRPLPLASLFLASTALAATSIGGHQVQVAGCRAVAARGLASPDAQVRADTARREEECLVAATDAVIPTIERTAGESADVSNAIQTHRDASSSFCAVLAESGARIEGNGQPAARTQCVAERESELARLIDEYAPGGQPPGGASGVSACDDAFKAAKASGEVGAWTGLATCIQGQLTAMIPSMIPNVASGDPLAVLSHGPDEIAGTFRAVFNAGNGVCDVLVPAPAAPAGDAPKAAPPKDPKEVLRLRCRAEVVANVAKAVTSRIAQSRPALGPGANVGN